MMHAFTPSRPQMRFLVGFLGPPGASRGGLGAFLFTVVCALFDVPSSVPELNPPDFLVLFHMLPMVLRAFAALGTRSSFALYDPRATRTRHTMLLLSFAATIHLNWSTSPVSIGCSPGARSRDHVEVGTKACRWCLKQNNTTC
jgi:hypothetical protein